MNLTFTYAAGDEEQPHRIIINLNGSQTVVGIESLKILQEFVHNGQYQLSCVLGQAIANIPPPKKIATVDEEFLNEVVDMVREARAELSDLTPSFDLYAFSTKLSEKLDEVIGEVDADDLGLDADVDDIKENIDNALEALEAKQAELAAAREAVEVENRMRAEEQRLKEAEQATVPANGAIPNYQ